MPGGNDASDVLSTRRSYDSTLRRQRASETRDRILAAAADLLGDSSIRDWRALTIRAVAERAGVNERTVYRHFVSERGLRDAVMHRFQEEVGIDLADLRLEHLPATAARMLEKIAAHPIEPRPPLDPTLQDINERRKEALRDAVAAHTADWPDADRRVAAAMFDVVWAVGAYERLVTDWQLDAEQAIRGIAWVVGLIEAAVRDGRRP